MKQNVLLILFCIILPSCSPKEQCNKGVSRGSSTTTQQQAEPIKTELEIKNTRFKANEPIIVDVWVKNHTGQDIGRPQFSPISSLIRGPEFVIARVPDGEEFIIPPGLYGDDWDQWYMPASGKEAFSIGKFILPAGETIHLLHGDLRLMILRARKHCQDALDEKTLLENPENAGTKKSYQEIVWFADDFLSGGTFDIHVRAYSTSKPCRITVENSKERNEMKAKETANKFVSAINRHDTEAISRLMTEDHTFIDSGGGSYGGDVMRGGWAEYFRMFPDYKIEISEVFASGQTVLLIGKASGTYTADGTLKPANHWQSPAVWKAVAAGDKIKLWQVFCDNTLVSEIVKKDKAN
jgi:ketosteroid isomerase-like protein